MPGKPLAHRSTSNTHVRTGFVYGGSLNHGKQKCKLGAFKDCDVLPALMVSW